MVAEFIAEEGVLKGLILTLEEGDEWTIGRDPDQADLVIEDPKSSRKHLLCRKTEQGYLIENLSDTNPVRINDHSILEPTLLHDGDKVAIGGTVFRFFSERSKATGNVEEMEPDIFDTEDLPNETIYEDEMEEIPEIDLDLSGTTRFVLKVISGPNTGAEFALDYDRDYLMGTDPASCDIVFYDLSVSREHARLSLSKEGDIFIQDLNSRNGVIIDRDRVIGRKKLPANTVVTLGTSSFLLIDKETPSQTVAAPVLEPRPEEKEEREFLEEKEEEKEPVSEIPAAVEAVKVAPRPSLVAGNLVVVLIVLGLAILVGIGLVSLFKTQEIATVHKDYVKEIQGALKPFPGVKFTFNPTTGKLFLVGNVSSGVQKNELMYNLQGLKFLHGIDDNIVIDEAVWQEMNLLLARQPDLQGVTMHSPYPGRFVLTGYLKTNKQATTLRDYMNLHFNYLDHLENRVIVEEQIIDETNSRLTQEGFTGVTPNLSNGELILTGYISSNLTHEFQTLVNEFSLIPGIRAVRNYVVGLSPEQAVVDLNERYPGRYQVTGYSKHGNVNINVVINGRLYDRGDEIDGMTITSIQPHTIFLEKDGLKYKMEYNK